MMQQLIKGNTGKVNNTIHTFHPEMCSLFLAFAFYVKMLNEIKMQYKKTKECQKINQSVDTSSACLLYTGKAAVQYGRIITSLARRICSVQDNKCLRSIL